MRSRRKKVEVLYTGIVCGYCDKPWTNDPETNAQWHQHEAAKYQASRRVSPP